MKRVLAAAVIALVVPWFASAQAAGRKKTPKGPLQPPVPVLSTQYGIFGWIQSDETLVLTLPDGSSSVLVDSVTVKPSVMAAKNSRDNGTFYYLDQGLLMAFSPGSAGLSGGERTKPITKDTTRKFDPINVQDYAGIALTTGGKIVIWKVGAMGDYVGVSGVLDYTMNPSYGLKKCPWGRYRPFETYPILLLMTDNRVEGMRWDASGGLLTAPLSAESTYKNLEEFLVKTGVRTGNCIWSLQKPGS